MAMSSIALCTLALPANANINWLKCGAWHIGLDRNAGKYDFRYMDDKSYKGEAIYSHETIFLRVEIPYTHNSNHKLDFSFVYLIQRDTLEYQQQFISEEKWGDTKSKTSISDESGKCKIVPSPYAGNRI